MTGTDQERWSASRRVLAIGAAALLCWTPIVAWWFL